MPQDIAYKDDAGVALGLRHTPVDAAGLYVPGGKAAYPSSVLMNALPATVAGVPRRGGTVFIADDNVANTVLELANSTRPGIVCGELASNPIVHIIGQRRCHALTDYPFCDELQHMPKFFRIIRNLLV